MPRMNNLRLSPSFCSFFLSSDMRIICIPHVPIVNPKTTLEWGFQKTKTHNHTYCYLVHLSGYTAPHTNCIYNLIYILHWLGFVWTWVHPKSTREIVTFPIKIAILWEYPHFQTHQCGGLTNKTKKTKSNPGTRATPMTHRMGGKIWKICRRKLGKQLLGLEPSQEQFSSTTDASSASWTHFDLNCCFNLVYFCCKTVVPVWTK